MDDAAKIKLTMSAEGIGKVEVNGVDLSGAVSAIEFSVKAQQPTRVKITLMGEIDAELEAAVLEFERQDAIRFTSLGDSKVQLIGKRK